MLPTVPYIPDNAPFTPEQRAWLNGFMAGVFSSAPQAPTATKPISLKFAVYFATQSGTAERLAKKIAKDLKAQGHSAEIASLDKTTPAQLAAQENALILASTYGEGDPTEGAVSFRDALFSDAAPALKTLRYSVFCLGDKHYEHFCKFGIDLDERLQALGGTRLVPRVESDVDVDEPFEQCKNALKKYLTHRQDESNVTIQANHVHPPAVAELVPGDAAATAAKTAEPDHVHTKDNPFMPSCANACRSPRISRAS